MVDLAVTIPALIGSICSALASFLVILCYLLLPYKRHFRHTLILNLASADFVNALNNSISGTKKLVTGSLPTGAGCIVNGFIGQLSVQGTDFSILLIAILTVVAVKAPHLLPSTSTSTGFGLSAMVWFVPFITSLTGLGLHDYAPVSGNWCWLSAAEPTLRYALAHGWRISIIFITIGLYTYLFVHFRRFYMSQLSMHQAAFADHTAPISMVPLPDALLVAPERVNSAPGINAENQGCTEEVETFKPRRSRATSYVMYADGRRSYPSPVIASRDIFALHQPHTSRYAVGSMTPEPTSHPGVTTSSNIHARMPSDQSSYDVPFAAHLTTERERGMQLRNKKIQRTLLLNSYPIMYVILWLPGIANRFVELGGKSSYVLQIMQGASQWVGFANAVTYGYNENVAKQLICIWKN